jgi:hypothetical protein
METSRAFMPLLTELGRLKRDFAINVSRLTALQRELSIELDGF